jgi:hypothetical protein
VNHSIEVAHLVNGEVISVRRLSRRRELREVAVALVVVGAAFVAATGLVAAVLLGAHRVVYGPVYGTVWMLVASAMGVLLGRRALDRARRYRVGVSIDDDAFAGAEVDLVRRVGGGYELAVVPGMTGTIAAGRSPIAVETLVSSGNTTRIPLGGEVRAEIALGNTTFVVRAGAAAGREEPVSRALVKRFARPTLTVVQLMAVASFLYAVPVGAALGEADMKSSIPVTATPWETEKALRAQAQAQARTLHRCFDPMPLECQRPGYVGIGLALSKSGEIRSNWIARSTYGKDCPVEQCMSEVAAGWFFEPLPESMQIVLPVQVLRTDKPLVPSEMASLPAAALPPLPVPAIPGAAVPTRPAMASDVGRVATVE